MSTDATIILLRDKLENLQKKYSKELLEVSKNIIEQTSRMESSWSGSWIGYHSSLYFGEYDIPNRSEMFSVEWGGINGFDSRWQRRTIDDIWEFIINNSTKIFNIDDVEDKLKKINTISDDLKTAYQMRVSNETLKLKVSKIKTDYTMANFIKQRYPKNVVSRDSEAMMQGIKIPPHIQAQAFGYQIRQNIEVIENLLSVSDMVLSDQPNNKVVSPSDKDELEGIDIKIKAKVERLFNDEHYTEAIGVAFRVVKDRLRSITGYESSYPAFKDGGLYIIGSAADNVDDDFQEAVKRLLGSIDKFRNEKLHTSEANLSDKSKALNYLHLCTLAMSFLSDDNYLIKK